MDVPEQSCFLYVHYRKKFKEIYIGPIVPNFLKCCIIDLLRIILATTANQFGFEEGTICSQAICAIRMSVKHFIVLNHYLLTY
jgi:hypothetical protein